MDRPLRPHRLARTMPYLDFYVGGGEEGPGARPPGVVLGAWPAETASSDLACQRAMLAAAAEARAQCRPGSEDREEAWRCAVHLDCGGPLAVVRVSGARRGPAAMPGSLAVPGSPSSLGTLGTSLGPLGSLGSGSPGSPSAASGSAALRCDLVVPGQPNAFVLETSILDYFAFTDRAVALQVPREREFAPVREAKGCHTPAAARQAMHALHCGWVISAGVRLEDSGDSGSHLEVSPLLSYEGEGLGLDLDGSTLRLPCHLTGPDEVDADAGCAAEGTADGLDTRPFYLQEYPSRPEVSRSHAPRLGGPGSSPTWGPQSLA